MQKKWDLFMKNKKELLKKEKICNVKNLNKRKKDQEKN